MTNNGKQCTGCGQPLAFDYIGERHAGCSITSRERSEYIEYVHHPNPIASTRKPKMSEARRKILNLLEYVSEVDLSYSSITEVVSLVSDGHILDDKVFATLLQAHADTIGREIREANRVDST